MAYYRDDGGAYLGAFEGTRPPPGAVEVPAPPADAAARWNGRGWDEPPPPPVLVPLAAVLTRVIAMGGLSAVLGVLQASPEAAAKLLTLREGIYADDHQARALFAAAGLDADRVLAP